MTYFCAGNSKETDINLRYEVGYAFSNASLAYAWVAKQQRVVLTAECKIRWKSQRPCSVV